MGAGPRVSGFQESIAGATPEPSARHRRSPEALQGAPDKIAFVYGPVVLAGDLGTVARSDTFPYARDQAANLKAADVGVPTLIGDVATIAASLRRVRGDELTFRIEGNGRQDDITLRPFADLHYERYNVYWTVVPPSQ